MRKRGSADDVLFRNLVADVGNTRVQHSPPNLDFEFVVNSVVPPASEIAKRVLSAGRKEGVFAEHGVVGDLEAAWSKMHFLRTPEEADRVATPLAYPKRSLTTRTLCQRVGYCMCGDSPYMQKRRRCRSSLCWFLKAFFP